MSKSFDEFAESWVFCGYSLLLYRWERCRVLARTPVQTALMDRMTRKLKEEMIVENTRREILEPTPAQQIVLQRDGDRYAGPLLMARFQVMGSFIGSSYYIADHTLDDLLLRDRGGHVRRFQTVEEAEDFLKEFTPPPLRSNIPARGVITAPGDKETDTMAKAATAAKAKKTEPKKGNPEALAKARASRGPSAASRFRELLMDATTSKGVKTCKLTDDEIFAKVAEEFGLDDAKRTYVAWYRNYLVKKGEDVPAARS